MYHNCMQSYSETRDSMNMADSEKKKSNRSCCQFTIFDVKALQYGDSIKKTVSFLYLFSFVCTGIQKGTRTHSSMWTYPFIRTVHINVTTHGNDVRQRRNSTGLYIPRFGMRALYHHRHHEMSINSNDVASDMFAHTFPLFALLLLLVLLLLSFLLFYPMSATFHNPHTHISCQSNIIYFIRIGSGVAIVACTVLY